MTFGRLWRLEVSLINYSKHEVNPRYSYKKAATAQTVGLLQVKSRESYLALDVLWGMTTALMIVVNTPGSWDIVYVPFRHAVWHGFTITDLVFPNFRFVIANAMSFSMRKFDKQDDHSCLAKVFKRTALTFLIGLSSCNGTQCSSPQNT